VPKAGVRPTQDRVREALFSILGARVVGAAFLDLFAGSGAVGVEAWSRGASRVCWVERSRRVFPVLRENVQALCGDAGRVLAGDAFQVLRRGGAGVGFDLVFADPPYRLLGQGHDLLAAAAAGGAAAPGCMAIVEREAGEPALGSDGWDLTDERVYGDTRLSFFVMKGKDAP
jgi:16S rRNA (guanine966-N2)-methyltransferase